MAERRTNWVKVMPDAPDVKRSVRPAPIPFVPNSSQPRPRGPGDAPSSLPPRRPETPPPDYSPPLAYSPYPDYSPSESSEEAFSFQGRWDDLYSDEFVGSEKVKAMNQANYGLLLIQNDVTFVFYYDPNDKRSEQAGKNVGQAAGCTKRASHGYAAVNCAESDSLCKKVGVLSTPYFRVYSGLNVTDNDCNATKTPDQIRLMVENNKVPATQIMSALMG